MTPIKRDYHVRYDCWDVPVACEITDEKCDPDQKCRHCNVPILSLLMDIKNTLEQEE